MSHFSRINTKMEDKKYILMALKDLGLEYEEGELQVNGFAGQKTAVDILVPLKSSYDIGLRKKGSGFEIVADWYGVRGVNQKDFSNRLMQRYAYHATRDKLQEQGFNMVEEKQEETGQIRIVLRRMA